MNLVARIRTQPVILLIALLLTFAVAVPLTVQTIAADASVASVAKKKKKKKKKCKKGYVKKTVKKKGKKVKKCVKKKSTPKPPATPTPPDPTPPPTKGVTVTSLTLTKVSEYGAIVRLQGSLQAEGRGRLNCTAAVEYADGFIDQPNVSINVIKPTQGFIEPTGHEAGHGAVTFATLACGGATSARTAATAP